MSNTSIDQMKKIIEDKKKKSANQGAGASAENKMNPGPSKAFKNTKRGGSLNK